MKWLVEQKMETTVQGGNVVIIRGGNTILRGTILMISGWEVEKNVKEGFLLDNNDK